MNTELIVSDPFGNYVYQKMLETAGEGVVDRATQALQARFAQYCLHGYACRVLQTLLDVLGPGAKARALFREIEDCLIYMSMDSQANHVAQKFIEVLGDDLPSGSIAAVTQEFEAMAFNGFGCRVIQKVIRYND